MYTDEDLDAAVAVGVLTADDTARFRALVAQRRQPSGNADRIDDEQFRLLTGFNDIFVAIAAVLLLLAVGWLLQPVAVWLATAGTAATALGLAEYFTRKRRMALPSIVLLLAFSGACFLTGLALLGTLTTDGLAGSDSQSGAVPAVILMHVALSAVGAALATYAHWRRFMVPITVAAGACTLLGAVVALLLWSLPFLVPYMLAIVFVGGVALFALALRWDASDRDRQTRRSDVAFWLHLAAAPMLIHPIFSAIGLTHGHADWNAAAVGVAVYIVIGIVSLAIDRRAMLVSALAYVLYAMRMLLEPAADPEMQFALAALLIGGLLLLLSASWHAARLRVLALLPQPMRGLLPVS